MTAREEGPRFSLKPGKSPKRTTAGTSRRRPLPSGAYWLKGTFSQPRTSVAVGAVAGDGEPDVVGGVGGSVHGDALQVIGGGLAVDVQPG